MKTTKRIINNKQKQRNNINATDIFLSSNFPPFFKN